MDNKGLSITLKDNFLSDTGASGKNIVVQKAVVSVAFLASVLSIYALSGSLAITRNVSTGFENTKKMVSITDSKAIEKDLQEEDFSFISAMGFEDDSVSFPDMFI
jgi:hypothetical protein